MWVYIQFSKKKQKKILALGVKFQIILIAWKLIPAYLDITINVIG